MQVFVKICELTQQSKMLYKQVQKVLPSCSISRIKGKWRDNNVLIWQHKATTTQTWDQCLSVGPLICAWLSNKCSTLVTYAYQQYMELEFEALITVLSHPIQPPASFNLKHTELCFQEADQRQLTMWTHPRVRSKTA